jgi:hypothetical protein
MPVLDRSRDLWLTAIAKRTREWRAALARDRRLRRIGAVGSRRRPRTRCGPKYS